MPFEPNPEFWKEVSYKKLWEKHMKEVNKLEDKLISKFPELKGCIKFGLGAKTKDWIKIPPDEKGEPDFTIFWNYKELCHIEVSGSDKVVMKPPENIWIRPDKFQNASNKKEKYWFYMVYKNGVFILDLEVIKPFKDRIIVAYIKKDPKTGRRVPERYIAIPCANAFPESAMFDWIEKKIKT